MSGILFLGFLLGMRHALEADHVAAVAVLATRAKTFRQAVPLGVMWGLGHTLTLFAFGAVIVVLNTSIPQAYAQFLEALVGLMLVGLGADVLYRLIRKRIHFHVHRHEDGNAHIHAHSHQGEKIHDPAHHRHRHLKGMSARALAVGMMHGLAGSAALVLLTMQTLEPVSSRIVYIFLFGIGSMVGMGVLSAVIAVPMRYVAGSMTWAYNGLSAVLGLFTTGLGLLTIAHAGVF
ncbi:MAG: urease accessory protein [Rhodospirillaceae bacterium]|nr:urease accessory protein [Rhodospirillaceae bacterium]